MGLSHSAIELMPSGSSCYMAAAEYIILTATFKGKLNKDFDYKHILDLPRASYKKMVQVSFMVNI